VQEGEPVDLVLRDNVGNTYNVDSKPFTVPHSYIITSPSTITWTLTAANAISPASTSTEWVWAAYWGVSADGIITVPEVDAANKLLVHTEPTFSPHMIVGDNEFGFIAVHRDSTNKIYTTWFIDQFNNGIIDPFDFIKYQGELVVTGQVYDTYVWNYKSGVNNIIKFE
jgi:hypothetical protein